ncbi:MAG: hypothetical protein B6242_15765 [Anaerolineaceae bacterium 4572_78]|nr:MAG: hypothetical protein B6242_15765 [Anaerolineaceae bacterium 4572_78]
MFFALTDGNNIPIGDLKIIGDHTPSGVHHVSSPSCYDFCKMSGMQGSVKAGNVTFEPPLYETGTWNLYAVDGGGGQISDVISIPVSTESKSWYFVLLRR